MAARSPFLTPGYAAETDTVAVLHLRRDLQIPFVLRSSDDQNEGYSEGKVTNTRFGSFPHSTLIGVPWGSQVRASAVDTGSRGRKSKVQASSTAQIGLGQKRKREGEPLVAVDVVDDGAGHGSVAKAAVVASTGFAHLLPPTPESWTTSLPHRTQVVYTPDYSYVLQRLRVRPGSVIIEAGAGSGSFTHAAARAVFNGYPEQDVEAPPDCSQTKRRKATGKVWSFEFHEQRVQKLKSEIKDHGLDKIVEILHRDVCADGFTVLRHSDQIVEADAIFLDLPAPWLALKHLTRAPSIVTKSDDDENATRQVEDHAGPSDTSNSIYNQSDSSIAPLSPALTKSISSPLSSTQPVHICTFSPCIEQVQRTVSTLRSLSYTSIETVELASKRLEVRRERVGLSEEGQRGVNASAGTVEEAVGRLQEMEGRTRQFHANEEKGVIAEKTGRNVKDEKVDRSIDDTEILLKITPERMAVLEPVPSVPITDPVSNRKLFKEGRLVHRSEPELKTHTSYLVFAILPREWTAEDEAKAQEKWGKGNVSATEGMAGKSKGMSRRQMKREKKAANGGCKTMLEQEALGNVDK